MQWSKPDFQDIPLGMEVTAYTNTDDSATPDGGFARPQETASPPAVPCTQAT
jgi:coenzyme PQQ precursor peptide PqqA